MTPCLYWVAFPEILIIIPCIQIKPLTEEEKKQRLEELRAKMAEKRSQKDIEEAKEHKANEALRRKAGKVRLMNAYISTIGSN